MSRIQSAPLANGCAKNQNSSRRRVTRRRLHMRVIKDVGVRKPCSRYHARD